MTRNTHILSRPSQDIQGASSLEREVGYVCCVGALEDEDAAWMLLAVGDPHLRETLEAQLQVEGYAVVVAADGETAFCIATTLSLSFVLLDLNLPGRDGLELCRLLRTEQKTARLPILMLATSSDETEAIIGLEVGADDYVRVPFDWRVLRARIRALLRRSKYSDAALAERSEESIYPKEQEQKLTLGNLSIDLAGRIVLQDGQPMKLSSRLFELLCYFAQHQGVVLTRKQLTAFLQKNGEEHPDARLIDTYVHWLREKLHSTSLSIHTVRGIGYRLSE